MSRSKTTLPDPYSVPRAHGPVSGRVELPGSKSITNRALIIAALAAGTSTLRGVLDSDDTRYMVEALQTLGFDVNADWANRTVTVTGLDGRISAGQAELFLGNSGTSMRFLTALCAAGRGQFRLDGTDAMRQRPIGPLLDALRQLGVRAESETGNDCPPITIASAGLEPGTVRMPGNLSSQYFSALAMVLPAAPGNYEIAVVGDLVSKPFIDLTASTMREFGVTMRHDDYTSISVEPGQRYVARDYVVEPDASAASYFFALAAVSGGSITVAALPTSSAQGDVHFVDVLETMGCTVERGEGITVTGPDRLNGVEVDMNAISDTVMSLAAIAPFASGPTTVSNVEHIRFKETDRLAATCAELRRMGIEVGERPDGLTIQPGQPQPAVVQTYDDHRMAMSFAITGTQQSGIQIADPGCVSKTLPEFWDLLEQLVGSNG